jgi:hypothetical protein
MWQLDLPCGIPRPCWALPDSRSQIWQPPFQRHTASPFNQIKSITDDELSIFLCYRYMSLQTHAHKFYSNSMKQNPSWGANSRSASQEIFHFYRTRRFITVFITSHAVSLRSILTLSSYQLLGISSGLFPSDFPTKILYAFLISLMCVTCPAHLQYVTKCYTTSVQNNKYQSMTECRKATEVLFNGCVTFLKLNIFRHGFGLINLLHGEGYSFKS